MNAEEKEQYRRYVKGWERTGRELEKIRRKELRELDEQKGGVGLGALAEIGVQYGRPRTTSGLVEMQKWFMKLARQQGLVVPAVGEESGMYRPDAGDSPARK